ncbi:MAG: hypothetical protein MR531_14570 [Lachnospiraceae bacterium]|nr:hypothetical protein [Lachnospiraceae bacterium]
MAIITYENISIQGVSYQRILSLEINQNAGEHAKANVQLEVDEAEGITFVETAGTDTYITIQNDADVIFCGVVDKAIQEELNGYPVLELTLMSTSFLLDLEPKTATYQKTSMSHEQLMNQVVGNRATILFEASDKPLGSWNYRNQETDWEFIQRLASQCGYSLITNVKTQKPVISIGVSSKKAECQVVDSEHSSNGTNIIYRTYDMVSLGSMYENNEYINSIKTFIDRGYLITQFTTAQIKVFSRKQIYNSQSACKMLTGKVQAIDKEKIQVFFDEIDDEYDSGDTWFEYSTPFATNGGAYGSGFYCMPEEGDRVRVFLPEADEGTAFAFGSVSVSNLDNPKNAKWRAPGGQEILFTEDGIRITGKKDSIYIDMNIKDEVGIKVFCDGTISLDKAKTIEINGDKGVTIYADNKVTLESAETKLEIDKEKIVFQGEYLQIN